ncbi:MAG: GNAT family N-acetyltransferase [Acidobacteriota bacterium]|nr:MAG: GNAT family N-acetyltransferase [Acidobacteriota bacterium]
MYSQLRTHKHAIRELRLAAPIPAAAKGQPARVLTSADTQEVLSFLRIRPVHTIVMTSFILDNGIESELNRGTFFGYRNAKGELEGVALIGHSTLVEARSDEALASLAAAARKPSVPIHLIMSGGDAAERFYDLMTEGRSEPRLKCVEALFEASFPYLVRDCTWKLENATMEDLIPVAEAQAEIAFIECGVDPMARDREGFLKRVARRIEQDRVFVVRDGDKMVFKADIISETEDAAYLEGVYVHPDHRGRGVAAECLSRLTLQLLDRVDNICLLSNVDFGHAHKSFEKAGYRRSDHCVTLFV